MPLLTILYKIQCSSQSKTEVSQIKTDVSPDKEFELAYVNAKDINQIIKSLRVHKAKGPDGISAKFVKMLADIIDCHIANIFNKDISEKKHSENAKTTNVRPIFRKRDRTETKKLQAC